MNWEVFLNKSLANYNSEVYKTGEDLKWWNLKLLNRVLAATKCQENSCDVADVDRKH